MTEVNPASWQKFDDLLGDLLRLTASQASPEQTDARVWAAIHTVGLTAVGGLLGGLLGAVIGSGLAAVVTRGRTSDAAKQEAERMDRARRKFDDLISIRDSVTEDDERAAVNKELERLFHDLEAGGEIVL